MTLDETPKPPENTTTDSEDSLEEATPTDIEVANSEDSPPDSDDRPLVTFSAKLEDSNDGDGDSEAAIEQEDTEAETSQEAIAPSEDTPAEAIDWERRVADLKAECDRLQTAKERLLQDQTAALETLTREALRGLEERKQNLEATIERLERRQERIREEMRTTFAGTSQELAVRVQGFKQFLVGSLQDLASTAEQLELTPPEPEPIAPPPETRPPADTAPPQFAENAFQDRARQVRRLLDRFRNSPDYYGPPWMLRRTFEPVHAERVSNWLFVQGGRGAIRSTGSRLQNIIVASASISALKSVYRSRLRTLVLADSPERLGEWRRGLQDCLGISRGDFGPDRGVVLFEDPEAVAQKAERLVKGDRMPLIVIDESEDKIGLSLLQFPLWMAFARDPDAGWS